MEEKLRAEAIQQYLLSILKNTITQLNINFLDSKTESYTLIRLPVAPIVEKWIIATSVNQEVYNFESRKTYSKDIENNLSNLGFFEAFEKNILKNNKNKNLPDIKNIESIECLNCGSLQVNDVNSAVFSVQIKINYREEN